MFTVGFHTLKSQGTPTQTLSHHVHGPLIENPGTMGDF